MPLQLSNRVPVVVRRVESAREEAEVQQVDSGNYSLQPLEASSCFDYAYFQSALAPLLALRSATHSHLRVYQGPRSTLMPVSAKQRSPPSNSVSFSHVDLPETTILGLASSRVLGNRRGYLHRQSQRLIYQFSRYRHY